MQAAFEKFINLPDSWPLVRIMIPLDGLLQVERIIARVALEVVATHQRPDVLFLARCCLGQVPGGAPFK